MAATVGGDGSQEMSTCENCAKIAEKLQENHGAVK